MAKNMENNCKATIDPLVIEMKNEQIEDLKDRLKRKEEELEKKTKEMKEELEKKDKEMKDAVATKDNELKAELARRETLLQTKEDGFKQELTKKDKMLDRLREQIHMKETYKTACYIFIFLLVFSVAVIATRQIEANGYWQSYIQCTQKVEELKEKTGGCGDALNELKVCRSKLEILNEVKGKHEAETNHSLALVKQADDLREIMTKREDQLAKEAESKESCEQYTRQLQANTHNLLQNVTILVREKTALELKYKTSSKQLSNVEHELETCSDNLKICTYQLKKSSSINRMETNLTPMYLMLIACVGMLIHWTCHL